jgi:hypothetical protein
MTSGEFLQASVYKMLSGMKTSCVVGWCRQLEGSTTMGRRTHPRAVRRRRRAGEFVLAQAGPERYSEDDVVLKPSR